MGVKYFLPVSLEGVGYLVWVSDVHSVHSEVLKSLPVASPHLAHRAPELSGIAAPVPVQTGDQSPPVDVVIILKAV